MVDSDTPAVDPYNKVVTSAGSAQQEKLEQIMQSSHEVLAHARTVFPFVLFPDDIQVDRSKVTITRRTFFSMAETYSIRIEDILNVVTTVGPIFGSLTLITRVFNTDKPHVINFLKRSDAVNIKHIVQGYVIALHNQIECSSIARKQLIAMLQKLGHDNKS